MPDPDATVAELVQIWISPLGRFTNTQQMMETLNNFVADVILIWRLYVVWGKNWYIVVLPICMAAIELIVPSYVVITTFVNPALIIKSLTSGDRNDPFDRTVTAGFSFMAATPVVITTLLAARILYVGRTMRKHSPGPGTNLSPIMWMLVESGSAMSIMYIIWLIFWHGGFDGAAQTVLATLGQFGATVPFSIIARVHMHSSSNSRTAFTKNAGAATTATVDFRSRPGQNMDATRTGVSVVQLKEVWKDSEYQP